MAGNVRPLMVEVERVPESVPGAAASAPPPAPAPAPEPEEQAERQAAEIQAMSEGVPPGDMVEFLGEKFRIGEKVGLMPLMRFSYHAKKGVNTDDFEGMAAMYELLKDCIHPLEWERFEQYAIDQHADGQELFNVVGEVIERLSARPTRQPGGSSSGPSRTTPSSTASSSAAGRRMPPGAEHLVPVDQLAASSG